MKKTNFVLAAAFAALTAFAATACDKSAPANDSQNNTTAAAPAAVKIAYVEVDSIMTQYQYCKDYSLILQRKGQNIQNTLQAKQNQLQAAAANFQQKLQQNAYTREQAEGIQAGLQKQQADLQALSDRLNNEFQAETAKFNNALRDSIQHFLAAYNKDKKYGLILSKMGDNVLYADRSYDITKQVVAGLNKAYKTKPAAAATEQKKEEKK